MYAELRRQAGRQMRRERRPHTLRPTALVHEAYLRLVRQRETWQNRVQFFAVAAKMMRRVLVDHARRHEAVKRDGAWRRVTLDEGLASTGPATWTSWPWRTPSASSPSLIRRRPGSSSCDSSAAWVSRRRPRSCRCRSPR